MEDQGAEPIQHIAESPLSNCLLLCDDVVESRVNEKQDLKGIINEFRVRELPAAMPPAMIYMRLTDVKPRITLEVVIERVGLPDDRVFGAKITVPNDAEPLGLYTIVMKVPPLIYRYDGRYELAVKHNGQTIVASPLKVMAKTRDKS